MSLTASPTSSAASASRCRVAPPSRVGHRGHQLRPGLHGLPAAQQCLTQRQRRLRRDHGTCQLDGPAPPDGGLVPGQPFVGVAGRLHDRGQHRLVRDRAPRGSAWWAIRLGSSAALNGSTAKARGVQGGAAARFQVREHGLGHQRVDEPALVPVAAVRFDQVGRHRRLQRSRDDVRPDGEQRGQRGLPELAAQHRGRLDRPPGARGELGHAAADDLAHAHRDVAARRVVGQQPHDLPHEERVAAGAIVHLGGPVDLHTRRRRQPLGHGPERQATEHAAPTLPLGRQVGEQTGQDRAGLRVAVGHHDGQRRRPELIGEEPQQPQRRVVGPVRVVEHDQQTRRPSRRQQNVDDRREQPEPSFLPGRRPVHRRAQRAHHLRPGPEGWRPRALPAPSPGRRQSRRARHLRRRLGQPGLADPRLTAEQHHPAHATRGVGDELAELVELPRAPQ